MTRSGLQQEKVLRRTVLGILLGLFLNTPAQGKNEVAAALDHQRKIQPVLITQNTEAEVENASEDEASTDERVIFLGGRITYKTADSVVSELLRLDAENPEADIYLYISSPGGSVRAGMAIYDVMQHIQADVVTINTGYSASMAAFLLAAGTPGKRFAFPHARVMIHKPSGGASGEAADIEIRAREIRYLTEQFVQLLSFHTGQPIAKIRRDTARDYYMSAAEALEYGIVDQIMEPSAISDTD
ncbi:MAG: ATP-dependent Clp protease proteolytic subunit [Spirulinaceae cyanobacterium]